MTQQKPIWLGTMRLWVWSLALLSGLRIWHCCELWWRSQMRLGFCVAVALAWASGYSSDLTPSLGTCICGECGPRKDKKKKRKRKEKPCKKLFCVSMQKQLASRCFSCTDDQRDFRKWTKTLCGVYLLITAHPVSQRATNTLQSWWQPSFTFWKLSQGEWSPLL